MSIMDHNTLRLSTGKFNRTLTCFVTSWIFCFAKFKAFFAIITIENRVRSRACFEMKDFSGTNCSVESSASIPAEIRDRRDLRAVKFDP